MSSLEISELVRKLALALAEEAPRRHELSLPQLLLFVERDVRVGSCPSDN